MWWDDHHSEEGYIRRLGVGEMLSRIAVRLRPELPQLGLGILLMLVAVAAELAGPLIIRQIIDQDIPNAIDGADQGAIFRSAALFLAVFLVGSAATYVQILIVAKVGLRTIARLKQDLFDHLLHLGMDYFDHHPPGRIMTRVESDTERLQNLFSEVSLALIRTVILLAGTFTIMLKTDVRITLAVIGLMIPFFIGALIFLRAMRKLYKKVRQVYADLATFVAEYVQGVPILQVYGRREWALKRLGQRNQARYRREVGTEFIDYGFWATFGTLEVLSVMLILYLGFSDRFGGALTLGTAVLFVEYTRRAFWPLVQFTEQLGFIQKAFASADRVFGILDTESSVKNRDGARTDIPSDWQEIRFENVRFGYKSPEGRDLTTEGRTVPVKAGSTEVRPVAAEGEASGAIAKAIDGVSFTIRRGERIALVGPSGGGKSTLVGLFLRFYEQDEGRITLDGVDIREYSLQAWRSSLGLVLQDIHLFPGTIAENLEVFLPQHDREQLQGTIRKLGAGDIFERLPQGLETELSEGGHNLSMGERQLLCFARALVRDPQILVLDEATSSVDPATEHRIQDSLERAMRGRTSVIVAHRLSTIVGADRILVLQNGQVVQEGRHEELLKEGGLYAVLYRLQFEAGDVA